METRPIIRSLLDNDLYKFTMQMAVAKLYPRAVARYAFINRGKTPFPDGFAAKLSEQVATMADLRLTANERAFLADKCYFLEPTYLDLLDGYRFDPSEVEIEQRGGELSFQIEGPWYRTILWEVPLMALASELYFKEAGAVPEAAWIERCRLKAIDMFLGRAKFADFGTRRRFSQAVQEAAVDILSKNGLDFFVGTSNIHLARLFNLTPIGTHAHEWFMGHAAIFGFRMANFRALEAWSNVYRGHLGTALTDTFTTGAFLRDFDAYYAKLFDGVRHDSGNPADFAETVIAHYENLRIDPKTKNIVFSDGLTTRKAVGLNTEFGKRIGCSFGIGTHFTNDVGHKALNMVVKMTALDCGHGFVDTVKLSDTPGKISGTEQAAQNARYELGIES